MHSIYDKFNFAHTVTKRFDFSTQLRVFVFPPLCVFWMNFRKCASNKNGIECIRLFAICGGSSQVLIKFEWWHFVFFIFHRFNWLVLQFILLLCIFCNFVALFDRNHDHRFLLFFFISNWSNSESQQYNKC